MCEKYFMVKVKLIATCEFDIEIYINRKQISYLIKKYKELRVAKKFENFKKFLSTKLERSTLPYNCIIFYHKLS